MKARIIPLIIIVAIMFSAFGFDNANAGAYATQFTSAVTYINVGTAPTTTLKLYFYATPSSTTPTSYTLPNAAVNAAGALFIGNVGDDVVADGFQGSAYMESDQMLQVTLVQIPQNTTTVKNRAMSNGFVSGGPKAYIPTVLKNYLDYTTIFSVQNADTVANNISIKFYDATTQALTHTINQQIAAGAAFYVDAGLVPELGTSFSGSVVVDALRLDASAGKIVTSAMELAINGTTLYSFEGFESGGLKLYMPSALCKAYGSSSAYAVQNIGTVATDITVTYTDQYNNITSQTQTGILPGAKAPFSACGVMADGGIGAAVVESTMSNVVAVGKVFNGGLSTAFNGVLVGAQELVLPYVRWATLTDYASGKYQRTYLTIQNIGNPLVETEEIVVEYYDYLGNLAGTFTYVVPAGGMPNGKKFATNPGEATDSLGDPLTEFGIYRPDPLNPLYVVFGGAAIVRGPDGSDLTAVARVQTILVYPSLAVGEDYNSQPMR